MKQIMLTILSMLTFQSAFAGSGDACAETHLRAGTPWDRARLVRHCEQNGYTAAHAETVNLLMARGYRSDVNRLFAWAKSLNLTEGQNKCARLYVTAGSDQRIDQLMVYCRDAKVTQYQADCAAGMNPRNVKALNAAFGLCHNAQPAPPEKK